MLAGAVAAIHLNIPVAHVHGGERSGTIDEPVRHAISKLSTYHCVATQASRVRLERMGESKDRLFLVGAPGLDGLVKAASLARSELCVATGISESGKIALLVLHPDVHTAHRAAEEARVLLDALADVEMHVVCALPNADAGNQAIRRELEDRCRPGEFAAFPHMPRETFVSWMAASDIMIGNSSAGIIEAATFGTPVINVGNRQNMRERNANIIDVPFERSAIRSAIERGLGVGRYPRQNIYGDGNAGARICKLLEEIPLGREVAVKGNSY